MGILNKQQIAVICEWLSSYDGPAVNIMEVCGSHTGAIAKSGIAGMLSSKIRLLSGPGCPVCVTPSAYIDRLIGLSLEEGHCVVTFGDLLRIPGSRETLSEAKGRGAHVKMVYSPFDILKLAQDDPDTMWIFAAVGFETTAPVYALLASRIEEEGLANIRLLTALKTMPEVIDVICRAGRVDGFLAPGHVSVITGSAVFEPLAWRYGIPFAVAGFQADEILAAIYGIVKTRGQGKVMNYYPSVVTKEGNVQARAQIEQYFIKADAVWRGLGTIKDSGWYLKEQYSRMDAGSRGLEEDCKRNRACRCSEVLTGEISPTACPLYGKVCTPIKPQGACMVSPEGSCRAWYAGGRNR